MTVCRFEVGTLSTLPLHYFGPPNIPFFGGNAFSPFSVVFMGLPITRFYPLGHKDRPMTPMGQLDHLFPRKWLLSRDMQALEVPGMSVSTAYCTSLHSVPPGAQSFSNNFQHWDLLRICPLHPFSGLSYSEVVSFAYTEESSLIRCPSTSWPPPSLLKRIFTQISLVRRTTLGTAYWLQFLISVLELLTLSHVFLPLPSWTPIKLEQTCRIEFNNM